MELFAASNDEQFEYIKKIIDTCDYYVLIVAARYGTINLSTGKSFTEQEYDYAVSKGIPILSFFHSNPYNLPYDKRQDDKKELLEHFRKKASTSRVCKMWSNLAELTTSVVISLNEQVIENPQKGWIRNNSKNLSINERNINQLDEENKDLKDQIKKLQTEVFELSLKLKSLYEENKKLSEQLKEAKIDNNSFKEEPISQNSMVIRYIIDKKEGKLYTNWLEILIKMRDDTLEGCSLHKIYEVITHNLLVGNGKIIDEDTQKIIEYMLENQLWLRIDDKYMLTSKGKRVLKSYGYFN